MARAKKCGACCGRGQIPDPAYKGRDPAWITCPTCDGTGQRDHPGPLVAARKQRAVKIELGEEAAIELQQLLRGIEQSCENDSLIALCKAVVSQIHDELS